MNTSIIYAFNERYTLLRIQAFYNFIFFKYLFFGKISLHRNLQNEIESIYVTLWLHKKYERRSIILQYDNYRFNQNKPPGAQHTYVLNEFSTANCSCKTKYFCKNSNRSLQSTSLRFFWHLLRPNWSIIRVTVSL